MKSIAILRDLTFEDVEDRYNWSLDQEVTKYLSFPDKYPPFTKQETLEWIKICMSHQNGYFQKAVLTEDGIHIGWVDLKNIDKTDKNENSKRHIFLCGQYLTAPLTSPCSVVYLLIQMHYITQGHFHYIFVP